MISGAAGINPQGDIVGIYHLAGTTAGMNHGFLVSGGPGGQFFSIDFPGAIATTAWKINATGKIVGRYTDANGKSHVFLRDPGGEFTSIDFPDAADTAPAAIPFVGVNARNDIVSTYCGSPCLPTAHGFLLSGDEFTSFDFPEAVVTVASGINFQRDIVGLYGFSLTCCDTSSKVHGFLRSGGN